MTFWSQAGKVLWIIVVVVFALALIAIAIDTSNDDATRIVSVLFLLLACVESRGRLLLERLEFMSMKQAERHEQLTSAIANLNSRESGYADD